MSISGEARDLAERGFLRRRSGPLGKKKDVVVWDTALAGERRAKPGSKEKKEEEAIFCGILVLLASPNGG